jgi:F420-non-reducing hydrogenase iron-sulfur subunit
LPVSKEKAVNGAFEPKILAFLCNWCSYAAADLAGISRCQYPPNIRTMLTMCSGQVDPLYVIEGLAAGFDAVFIFG